MDSYIPRSWSFHFFDSTRMVKKCSKIYNARALTSSAQKIFCLMTVVKTTVLVSSQHQGLRFLQPSVSISENACSFFLICQFSIYIKLEFSKRTWFTFIYCTHWVEKPQLPSSRIMSRGLFLCFLMKRNKANLLELSTIQKLSFEKSSSKGT